uniref:Uncharacterized protein AlNc14C210G8904 n=1 Tax=Albugo laibachii Nc14 TaxID=890382 RepID=F0WR97_9STRA|nr:conserved hypothetical protein [Albugo laibachii Nc14]CCA24043.1 conserved hypothetical protein [Albugo laibachii Nc14]|eukprot:CCA24043.1 conserved hypothetical protein [Albugo laibachii Nc14]
MTLSESLAQRKSSRLLQSFRAVGLIVDENPVITYRMGNETFLLASIKKAFVIYNCAKLTPVMVSPQLACKKISAMEVYSRKNLTFTASGRVIFVWKRLHQVTVLKGHKGDIQQLLVVGTLLFSLDDANDIQMWDIDTLECIEELEFDKSFTPSVMMHPATYLNKILVGSHEGTLELWNVRIKKRIFTFTGWNHQSICCITQSPAVDVVAIALADGRVMIHNLQYDQLLMEFKQESKATAIAFQTDTTASIPIMVTGSANGDIAVWNLQRQRLESILPKAHDSCIVSLLFLPNEPLLISSGTDNALKVWIFDRQGQARLLKSRQGHKAPPKRIRYYGNNTLASMRDGADGTCCQILSAGQDRSFRVFHTVREQQSQELSQGPLLKKAKQLHVPVEELKLSPITQFAAMETRERDWNNLVTCHESEIAAYVWRFEHRAIGKKILRQYDASHHVHASSQEHHWRLQTQATSCTISSCGHFAIIGSLGGALFKYNMQSSERRGSYPTAVTPKPTLSASLAKITSTQEPQEDNSFIHQHQGAVTGVAVDATNNIVMSAGMDGKLKFWDFCKHLFIDQIDLAIPISQLELHRDSNLIAVASDDHILRLYDASTRKLVRRFRGHTHCIKDLSFSNDARWLLSCSADASLRFWDIPTGKCIDWVQFQQPVTGLTISPTSEFIATTHVGQLGIYLWANRTFFADVFVDSEPNTPTLLDLPAPTQEAEDASKILEIVDLPLLESADVIPNEASLLVSKSLLDTSPLGSNLITLSTAPKALWQTLFHLELIKKRNKPIEPPKAPEKAPFFLPSIRKDASSAAFVSATAPAASKKSSKSTSMEGWASNSDKDESAWAGMNGDVVDQETTNGQQDTGSTSRILKSTKLISSRCKLAVLLEDPAYDAHKVLDYLQALSASSVDVELSTLCLGDFDEDGKKLLFKFLEFLQEELATHQHFQLLQVYLNRFLKLYEQIFIHDEALLKQVIHIGMLQQEQWSHLQQQLQHTLCLVKYLNKIQM